jgi:hypothetical protein
MMIPKDNVSQHTSTFGKQTVSVYPNVENFLAIASVSRNPLEHTVAEP